MKETNNLKLKKPAQNDFYNIDDFNYNADVIDEAVEKVNNKTEANKTSILNKVDIVVTEDRNITRKDKTFYFIVTDEQSTGGSTPSGDIKVSPSMGIKIV